MITKKLPSQSALRELLHYNPTTGDLTWKTRGREWFKSDGSCKSWNTKNSGKVAGRRDTCHHGKTYIKVKFDGVIFRAHRLIWVYVHNTTPEQVDHIDGDGTNNKLSNIRAASPTENARNHKLQSNNTSGVAGVNLSGDTGRWQVRISSNGRRVLIGSYDDANDAISARLKAEVDYGYHENHGSVRPL